MKGWRRSGEKPYGVPQRQHHPSNPSPFPSSPSMLPTPYTSLQLTCVTLHGSCWAWHVTRHVWPQSCLANETSNHSGLNTEIWSVIPRRRADQVRQTPNEVMVARKTSCNSNEIWIVLKEREKNNHLESFRCWNCLCLYPQTTKQRNTFLRDYLVERNGSKF